LALPATSANQKELEARLVQRSKQLAERKGDAERLREVLGDRSVEIRVKAGEERIYGSVGSRDISDAIKAAFDVTIDRRKIDLREPIKTIGEYVIPYRPHPEVVIELKVTVLADG
jgi:large subunit ribosomal protein L9